MSCVWKHPQSKYWIARFTDLADKKRNRTTRIVAKEGTRRQAERIAEAFEEAANKKRTSRQVRDVIMALHKEISGNELASHSLSKFVESWLARKKPEVAPSTFDFYEGVLEAFTGFFPDKAAADVGDITADDVILFRNHQALTRDPNTVNHHMKALRMFFGAARRQSLISDNPTEFVDPIKKRGNKKRRPFTIPELQSVIGVSDPEWKSLIYFGLYTGQRLGDLASLTWQNVDLLRGEIRLSTRKNAKGLILPIALPLRRHIESLPAGDVLDAPLHARAFGVISAKGRSGTLSNQFVNLLAQTGLREKVSHRKKKAEESEARPGTQSATLSFHSLRHTAVSLMKDAGIPAAVVMELVGHDSEQMSEHYTHVGKEALEKAANSLPDISKT